MCRRRSTSRGEEETCERACAVQRERGPQLHLSADQPEAFQPFPFDHPLTRIVLSQKKTRIVQFDYSLSIFIHWTPPLFLAKISSSFPIAIFIDKKTLHMFLFIALQI